MSSHSFDGITIDPAKGGYNLVGEGLMVSVTLDVGKAQVLRAPSCGFTTSRTWATVSYPNATRKTADAAYQNIVLGVYMPGIPALHGHVANMPTSLDG